MELAKDSMQLTIKNVSFRILIFLMDNGRKKICPFPMHWILVFIDIGFRGSQLSKALLFDAWPVNSRT